jgi:CRISPR type III-B/RAMP module RAMP protein Cmr6
MTELPLPRALRPFVGHAEVPAAGTNRSLLFNRGFDRYDSDWQIVAGKNQEFLEAFRDCFAHPSKDFRSSKDFGPFVERRTKALELAGVQPVTLRSQSRLVLGLGLPHPSETSLLLDRLTGCPYVPGSSLKGVLRAAARLVAAGELATDKAHEGDRTFWAESIDRLFGPALGGEATPAKGLLLVHDAFPEKWPVLELDVLTPHYGAYYSDSGAAEPPADWLDPNPVSFLAVQPDTSFTFWLGHAKAAAGAGDLAFARRLLQAALGSLGLGGKTSSGYGVFAGEKPALCQPVTPSAPEPEGFFGNPPPDPNEVVWNNVELFMDRSIPTIVGPRGENVRAFGRTVPQPLLDRIERDEVLRVKARVKPGAAGRWTLVEVKLE